MNVSASTRSVVPVPGERFSTRCIGVGPVDEPPAERKDAEGPPHGRARRDR
jgi:hypothetical protein